MAEELKAFLFAWQGSIEFQGGGPLAEDAMPVDEIRQYFIELAMPSDLPLEEE